MEIFNLIYVRRNQSLKAYTFCILLFLLYSIRGNAQEITVTGVVSDASGETLSGVSVAVKGTTHGTITNMDGKYTLDVSNNSILVFSFIGMKTEEIKVGGRKVINMTLEDDTKLLDEVVVVGYGTQRKN